MESKELCKTVNGSSFEKSGSGTGKLFPCDPLAFPAEPRTRSTPAAVVIPPAFCKHCGKEFQRTWHRRRYCSEECSDAGGKTRARAAASTQFWSDPELGRAKARERYANNKDYWREYSREHYVVPCTVCGTKKRRGDLSETEKRTYVCQPCQKESRKLEVRCYFCGTSVRRDPWLPRRQVACHDCQGILTVTSSAWGISRERVRQLVVKKISQFAVNGYAISRRDALRLVEAERLGQPLPKVNLRLVAP